MAAVVVWLTVLAVWWALPAACVLCVLAQLAGTMATDSKPAPTRPRSFLLNITNSGRKQLFAETNVRPVVLSDSSVGGLERRISAAEPANAIPASSRMNETYGGFSH